MVCSEGSLGVDLVRDADDLLLPLMKSIYSNVDRCFVQILLSLLTADRADRAVSLHDLSH